jgi:hypothetical protein
MPNYFVIGEVEREFVIQVFNPNFNPNAKPTGNNLEWKCVAKYTTKEEAIKSSLALGYTESKVRVVMVTKFKDSRDEDGFNPFAAIPLYKEMVMPGIMVSTEIDKDLLMQILEKGLVKDAKQAMEELEKFLKK